MGRGFVSLVGAGPGDPELLTLRAVARLREADLVLYDALAGREAQSLAPRARWFYVGKRARRRSIAQETIERLMIRAAQRGERVVRLKCGDPFVLGRGGEEALALARAGVPYEVVPGVTSAVAGPALAGQSPDARPPSEGAPEPERAELEAVGDAAAQVVDALVEALEWEDEREDVVAFACRRRAEIVADPGWLEVRLALDEVATEVRRAALDLDPGFVPWLGVVVRFVYE